MEIEKLFKTLLICAGLLLVSGFVCIINIRNATYRNLWTSQNLPEHSQGNSKSTDSSTPVRHDNLPPLNILLLGLDDGGYRTDVIILASYNPVNKTVNLLSFPRDTKVNYDGSVRKINSLYSKEEEIAIRSKVEEITGLKIRYHVTVDFEGFRKLVDAFDGVRIDVPVDLKYDDPYQNLHINLKKGVQTLDGNKAEQFVRFRKGNYYTEGYDGGDLTRINSQQIFIKEFIKQKANIKYISRADQLFNILSKYVKTDISLSYISPYFSDILDLKGTKMNSYTLPGDSVFTGETWYYIYDRKALKDLINQF